MALGKVAKKNNGRSGCGGVVTEAVDRGNWITISKFAVPLKACTAMAAEIAGFNMLMAVLDVFSDQKSISETSTVVFFDEIMKYT